MSRCIKKHDIVCADCDQTFARTPSVIKRSLAKHGRYICRKCSQQLPAYREKLSASVKASDAYKASRAIVSQKLTGAGNPQFGKQASQETRAKMSASRTGKLGERATAWKGGKQSLVYQVKKLVNQRHQWAKRIYERDNWICTSCGSKKKLDAHHTIPFATLLKEVHTQSELQGASLIDWLANHPVLKDAQGITLCRECHRAVHQNWGSHNPETANVQL